MTKNLIETTEISLPDLATDIEVTTEKEIRRSRMLEVVRQYISDQEWNVEEREREDGGTNFMMNFRMKHGTQRVFMDVFGDGDRFAVFAYAPVNIPEESRTSVAVYTTLLNHSILIGKLEMDMDDGELRMAAAVDVEGSQLSTEMISSMENITIIGMDKNLGAILKIVYGNCTPQEAYAAYRADS